jgi:hypothetical protein
MGIQKFDKSKWIDMCAAVSTLLLGKRAEIEVVSPIDGILIGAHWLPVIGITYDPAKDELKIMLDGVDHLVFQPLEMHRDLGFDGVQSLGILDKDNAWQIVRAVARSLDAAASGGDHLIHINAAGRPQGLR